MFQSDQPYWYNVGCWGELGFACPNFGDDLTTLNEAIYYLVDVIGRNLQAAMVHPDADLRRPPTINTLTRVHKLIVRARSILAGRQVDPATPDMEGMHASPAARVFLIYPTPYFRVRNPWMREYCGLALAALSEAMQHTDNRKAYEIGVEFAGLVGQYLHRIYKLMATELFGVPAEEASRLDFTLTDEILASYDPSQYFTSTEMVDTVPALEKVPTEDDLKVLTAGIPASDLVGLVYWPASNPDNLPTGGGPGAGRSPSGQSFAKPPSP